MSNNTEINQSLYEITDVLKKTMNQISEQIMNDEKKSGANNDDKLRITNTCERQTTALERIAVSLENIASNYNRSLNKRNRRIHRRARQTMRGPEKIAIP